MERKADVLGGGGPLLMCLIAISGFALEGAAPGDHTGRGVPPFGKLRVSGATMGTMKLMKRYVDSDNHRLWQTMSQLKPTFFHTNCVYWGHAGDRVTYVVKHWGRGASAEDKWETREDATVRRLRVRVLLPEGSQPSEVKLISPDLTETPNLAFDLAGEEGAGRYLSFVVPKLMIYDVVMIQGRAGP